jgi:hypothetical protein
MLDAVSILVLIPVANIIALWTLAFVRWPALASKAQTEALPQRRASTSVHRDLIITLAARYRLPVRNKVAHFHPMGAQSLYDYSSLALTVIRAAPR